MEDRTYFWTMFFVFTLCFTNLDGAIFPIALEGLENLYGGETHDTGPIIARRQEEPVQQNEEAVTEKAVEEDGAGDKLGKGEDKLGKSGETVNKMGAQYVLPDGKGGEHLPPTKSEMGAQYVLPNGKGGEHLPPTKSDMGAQYVLPDGKGGEHLPPTKSDMGAEYVLPDGKEGTHLPESLLTRSTRCSTGREITVGPDFVLSSSDENNKSGGDNKIDQEEAKDGEDIKNDEDMHTTTKRTGRPYKGPGQTKIPGHYIDDN